MEKGAWQEWGYLGLNPPSNNELLMLIPFVIFESRGPKSYYAAKKTLAVRIHIKYGLFFLVVQNILDVESIF